LRRVVSPFGEEFCGSNARRYVRGTRTHLGALRGRLRHAFGRHRAHARPGGDLEAGANDSLDVTTAEILQQLIAALSTLPWDSLDADEKRLFSRMAEVYAGFLAHADHHIGRLLDYLEQSGHLDNTLVIVVRTTAQAARVGRLDR
jgi:hypothetical protein